MLKMVIADATRFISVDKYGSRAELGVVEREVHLTLFDENRKSRAVVTLVLDGAASLWSLLTSVSRRGLPKASPTRARVGTQMPPLP